MLSEMNNIQVFQIEMEQVEIWHWQVETLEQAAHAAHRVA